jgi:Zn-dependent protease
MLFYLKQYTGTNFIIIAISYLLAILLALSLHEFAHAFAAYKCGDTTPKMEGRVSLNPLRHIDPIGILCCAFFGFGWARPVRINPSNFRNVKKGITWTSIAGVLMNFALAFVGYGIFELLMIIPSNIIILTFFRQFFYFLFIINLSLGVFNFLPIYPLDGFKLVENLTKYNNGYVQFMHKYGSLVLVLLILCFDTLLISLINLVSIPITAFWHLFF